MKTVTIRLTMMTDNVKNFVSLVNRYPYDMDLRSGRYVVDAKSILGIFSIDLSRPITMSIYSDDCDDLLKELDSYIVKDGEEKPEQKYSAFYGREVRIWRLTCMRRRKRISSFCFPPWIGLAAARKNSFCAFWLKTG